VNRNNYDSFFAPSRRDTSANFPENASSLPASWPFGRWLSHPAGNPRKRWQAVPHHRHIMKAQKIRQQLGGSPNMLEGFLAKPKGMYWKRYERLQTRHDAATERYLGMSMAWLRQLRARFPG
jgi:hypothetical protein